MTELGQSWAGGQKVGRRARQEDAYAVLPHSDEDSVSLLLVVADGMGGHAGGAEAAQGAVDSFIDAFGFGQGDPGRRLEHALGRANAALAELKRDKPSLHDAGCTLIAALVQHGSLSWTSVGDSSLSLLRDGVLQRLSADHSMKPVLEELVESGRMSAEGASSHPQRNALRSAVSGDNIELVDLCCNLALQPDDQVLLASDGLDTLSSRKIAELLDQLSGRSPDEAVAALLDAVEKKDSPSQDNTTVVLYRAPGAADSGGREIVSGLRSAQQQRLGRVLLAGFFLIAAGVIGWRLTSGGRSPARHDNATVASTHMAQPARPRSGPR